MPLTVGDIPYDWEAWRRTIAELFPDHVVILAGGCLRDLENNKHVRDVDIFTNIGKNQLQRITREIKQYGGALTNLLSSEYGNNLTGEFLYSAEFTNVIHHSNRPALNVIGINYEAVNAMAFIERFDFGLCQIYSDGYVLHKTPAYVKDQENRTWTLIRCENQDQFNRSMKRWNNKFREKYNGWDLVIPEEFSIYTDKEIQWLMNNNRGWYNILHGKSFTEEDFRKGILQDQPFEFR